MQCILNPSPLPWHTIEALAPKLSGTLDCDALAVGFIDARAPRAHSILHSEGFTHQSLRHWLDATIHEDSVFRQCASQACATGPARESGLQTLQKASDLSILHASVPTARPHEALWLGCAASTGPFTTTQQDAAVQLLRHWLASLASPAEHSLQHLIITSAGEPIYRSPLLAIHFEQAQEHAASFASTVLQCISQRWDPLPLNEPHDLVLPLGQTPLWITATRRRALDDEQSEHWLLECRAIEPDELPVVGVLPDTRVARALAYIHDYYFDSPSLNDLAAHVQTSPFHFHRLFAKQVGVSPKQYLLQKQMQVGRWRLRQGLEPIGEIAEATGFANHAHFTSTFRRMFKVAPSEYQLRALRRIDSLRPYGARTQARPPLRAKPPSHGTS
ncbi:MAG: helix-turn-helix transcriptional regulator [Planctomycetota bacterium]|jgi:AraC-like DNA-binding protein